MKLKMNVARAYKSPYEAQPTPCTLLCVSARYTPEAGLYVERGDIKDGVFYPNKGGEWMYEAFMDLLDCTREPKASETREKFRLLIGGDGDPMAQLKPIRIELNVAGAKEGRP